MVLHVLTPLFQPGLLQPMLQNIWKLIMEACLEFARQTCFSLAFPGVTLHIAVVLIGVGKALQLVQFSLALVDAALFLYKFILSLNKILPFIFKKKKKVRNTQVAIRNWFTTNPHKRRIFVEDLSTTQKYSLLLFLDFVKKSSQ